MKKNLRLVISILVCIAISVASYFWATGTIDSSFAYRSVLKDTPPEAGAKLGNPATHRLVMVLVDGLRLDTAMNAEVMPFLASLRDQAAATAAMHSQPPSFSQTGYSVLFTGAWPEISDGPAFNLGYDEIPTWTQDNLFSAAHRAGMKTAISGYYWFEKLVPQSDVDAFFYTPGEDRAADEDVLEAALPMLDDPSYQLVLIHLDQVDYAGHHEGGAQDVRWNEAATRADTMIQEIAMHLNSPQDTLAVFSDHGHTLKGGHGGQDSDVLLEPFILVGSGVIPGTYADMQMVDVAPTFAALLGINLPATSQGNVLTPMLALPQSTVNALPAAMEAQQKNLVLVYSSAIGKPVDEATLSMGGDPLPYQYLMQNLRDSRLSGERWPRAILAVLILVSFGFLFPQKTSREWAWLIGSAIVYALLFNVAYLGILGRTYSLSSIPSSTGLILETGVSAAVSLLIVWIIMLISQKTLKLAPPIAAGQSICNGLIVLYLGIILSLLHFTINGLTPTWALPIFSLQFVALSCMIQMLVVGILTPVFTGLTALAAKLSHR